MPDRPARLRHVVGLVLKFMRDSQGTPYTLLKVFDMATMYNLILLCGSTSLSVVTRAVKYQLGIMGRTIGEKGGGARI